MKVYISCVVIADQFDRVLLLHRTSQQGSGWELPASQVEHDEPAESAAVRAARDELGVGVRLVKNLGTNEAELEEGDVVCHWFQAVISDGIPDLTGFNGIDDLAYFDLEDMLSLAVTGSVEDLMVRMSSGEVALDRQ